MNLDLFWLCDRSLEDAENLPEPEVLATEIVEDLRTTPEAVEAVAAELEARWLKLRRYGNTVSMVT